MATLVSVGNARQPFPRLLSAITALEAKLPPPVVVQHGHTPFACPQFTGRAFMPMDEFAARLKQSQLIILHAGAGSILQAVDAGKCPVVMPRRSTEGEHIDDHQCELAQAFAKRGLIELAMEVTELEAAVERARARKIQLHQQGEDRLSHMLAADLQNYARDSAVRDHRIMNRS